MSYIIGKRMTSYPPRPSWEVGQPKPYFTGAAAGLPHTGSVLTCSLGTGTIVGASPTIAYQWWLGTRTAYASATNASYSMSADDAGSHLTCRVFAGNATWGTNYFDVTTGTIIP